MEFKNLKPTFFISLVLFLSLFLPWFLWSGLSTNGWMLPVDANMASYTFVQTADLGEDPLWVKLLYLFYIIPAVAAYNMVLRVQRRRPAVNEFFLGFAWAAAVFLLLRWAEMKYNNTMVGKWNRGADLELYKLLSAGYFIFLVTCLIGMYFTLVKEVDDYKTFEEEMEEEYGEQGLNSQPEPQPQSQVLNQTYHQTYNPPYAPPTSQPESHPHTRYMPEPLAAAANATTVAAAKESDRAVIYERLAQLHGLYEKGILGQAEYEAEKAALLSELPTAK